MATYKPSGPRVYQSIPGVETLWVETPKWSWLGIDGQYGAIAIYTTIETWRDHAYYDEDLHIKITLDANSSKYVATNDYQQHTFDAKFSLGEGGTGRAFYESGAKNFSKFPPEYYEETFRSVAWISNNPIEIVIKNKDRRDEWIEDAERNGELIVDALIANIDTGLLQNSYISGTIHIYDKSTDGSGGSHDGSNSTKPLLIQYPPYREITKYPIPTPPSVGSTTSGKDIGKGTSDQSLVLSRTYSISKVGLNQTISWTPNGTQGDYNEPVVNKAIVQRVQTFDNTSSPLTFTTPSPVASTYTAYVERYFANYPDIMTRSNTVTLYTYSQPSLSGITLSKYNISPRAGEGLKINLSGFNNKTHGIENNFRTGVWSNIKSKYYLDAEDRNNYKDLSLNNIKVMFPDSSAVNGVLNGTIYVTRRNLGVSGGNPGNGSLVYETGVSSKNIKVQYKPNDKIDVNREPGTDESGSGLCYYKNENNLQGDKLTAGHTWVLPNTYNLSNMTGVNVKLQYPKTDTSGVLSGYRIRLYSPNDGSPDSNVMYYETYWYTTDYTFTGTVPYDKLRRGISGNVIEITPFYIPDNVSKGSTGSYWYGQTVTKKFVDIAWMLDDPIIDCPLNDTTWHNHKYRILFKLPNDKDTNYKGQNDIEKHYGKGNYRYQEIELKINGKVTAIGNNAYMNAQNGWNTPVNISNAKLTFKRPIIINPVLISSYTDTGTYTLSIRVRKAYGQNPNWDGWSNWSKNVVVKRKTVKNDVVNRHETIMASHYMTVQTAFNNSTACYAKTASDNKDFIIQESFDRKRGDNINGPHLSPPENTPLGTVKEYVSEFNDLHQLKNKINAWGTFDTDKNRNPVKLDYEDNLLKTFTPSQEFITAAKDQDGATENTASLPVLKGRNYMKYMCDELNHLY